MGPLNGYKILELSAIGPTPMAGMLLADMGADVIRIDRPATKHASSEKSSTGKKSTENDDRKTDISFRGKRSIVLDLKHRDGVATLLQLVKQADVLVEGYRPNVAERLGFGPDICLQLNPQLIYARMTGWGQTGPLSQTAGHDINFIALTGALHAIGKNNDNPVPPLNLVGDMGGGGMLLVQGVLAALLETQRSGQGQVIDVAMTDGAAQLMWMTHTFLARGEWDAEQRQANQLDGGAYFYGTYATLDKRYVAIGAIEPQFHQRLLHLLQIPLDDLPEQNDTACWPQMRKRLAAAFKRKTQHQWCDILQEQDVCFAPVLSITDAPNHPHNQARNTYITVDGMVQPAPAPRFSRTPADVRHGSHQAGADTDAVLGECGLSPTQIAQLKDSGAIF